MDPVAPHYSSPPIGEPESEEAWLDAYHQELVQRVLDKDTPASRRELAGYFVAQLTGEIHALRQDQTELGTADQMAAIRGTGWTGWARFFVLAGWVVVLVDTLIWFMGGSRLLDLS